MRSAVRKLPKLHRHALLGLVTLLACALPGVRAQKNAIPVVDEYATMANRLGGDADLGATFTDTQGRTASLREFVSGERPVVLNLQYFTCPGMCSVGLNGLLEALQESEMVPGRELDVLTVSIDPRETMVIAGERKAKYLAALGKPGVGDAWKFLVGDAEQVRRIADSVGWRFRWSEHTERYDHPPALVLLSPDGVTTRYLDYRTMPAETFRKAIVEAGDGKVGSFLERIFVSCLTFDPTTGVYTLTAMTVMRIGGAVTVLALAIMIFVLVRRERAKAARTAENLSVEHP